MYDGLFLFNKIETIAAPCKQLIAQSRIPAVRYSRKIYPCMMAYFPINKIETLAAPCKKYR
jgi:hypothetical protein